MIELEKNMKYVMIIFAFHNHNRKPKHLSGGGRSSLVKLFTDDYTVLAALKLMLHENPVSIV